LLWREDVVLDEIFLAEDFIIAMMLILVIRLKQVKFDVALRTEKY